MAFPRKWKNMSGTRTYYAWRSMRSRCLSESNDSYPNYGGRGIRVCDRWVNNYDAFFDDMGPCPEGLTLERINVDRDYEPGNCIWADWETQAGNKRVTTYVELNGDKVPTSRASEMLGLDRSTLYKRIKVHGIDPSVAITGESLRKQATHGTRQMYEKHKCKCELCRAANAERHRNRRAVKKGLGVQHAAR